MNMNGGRMFYVNETYFKSESEDIFQTVQGVVLTKLLTKIQCSSFYKDYFEQNFYL